MTQRQEFPPFKSLHRRDDGRPTAWGVGTNHESIGRMALQTPERVVRAARLVRTGRVFPLDVPLNTVDPPFFGRKPARHTTLVSEDQRERDDVLDSYYPQGGSQWDSFAHVALEPDLFYGGATFSEVNDGTRNSINHIAQRGIAGRAVLLDVEAIWGLAGESFDPLSAAAVDAQTLSDCLSHARLALEPGDVVLVHTGFLSWYRQQSQQSRRELAARDPFSCVGLDHTEDVVRFLWGHGVAAVVTDAPALEVQPQSPAEPFGHLHPVLLAGLGLMMGELWWLFDLAADCAVDHVYEMLLASAPTNFAGGSGSAANALAIK